MNLPKFFIGSLGQYMHQAARPLGSLDSSNPSRWRGKWLHHHGGDVSCVFVLCVAVSSGRRNLLCVEKYQNITLRCAYCLTIWLIGVYLFGQPARAPCQQQHQHKRQCQGWPINNINKHKTSGKCLALKDCTVASALSLPPPLPMLPCLPGLLTCLKRRASTRKAPFANQTCTHHCNCCHRPTI